MSAKLRRNVRGGGGSDIPLMGARLFHMGHSLGIGGASSPLKGWVNRLSALLRSSDQGSGQGGAVLTWEERGATGDGGWSPLFNSWTPTPGGAPYLPPDFVPMLHYGNNDLGWGKDLRVYLETLTAAIIRLQCGAVFEDTDPSVVYNGAGWPAPDALVGKSSGGGARHVNRPGQSFTITVPADFPGGEVDLGFVAVGDPSKNGILDFTVDGVARPELTVNTVNTGYFKLQAAGGGISPWVVRIKNLEPGGHVIVVNVRANPAPVWTWFDWWGIRAQPDPIVLVCGMMKAISYAAYTAPLPTDADVEVWDAAVRALCEGIPGAKYINIDPLGKNPKYFSADQLHPNDLGHALITDHVMKQLRRIRPNSLATVLQTRETPGVATHVFVRLTQALNIPDAVAFGNLTGAATNSTQIQIAAQPGDEIVITPSLMIGTHAQVAHLDVVFLKGLNGAAVRYLSSLAAAALGNGYTPWLAEANVPFTRVTAPAFYRVVGDELVNGVLTLRLRGKQAVGGGGPRGFITTAPNIGHLLVENKGQPTRTAGYG